MCFLLILAKQHTSQMRPRSRCLTVVHKEILNDVCFPSHIAGRSVRVSIDGHRHQRVFLDPLDREIMDNRIDAITHCYHALTTHKIALGYAKPSHFQQKIIAQRNAKNWANQMMIPEVTIWVIEFKTIKSKIIDSNWKNRIIMIISYSWGRKINILIFAF